jgi:hypothetical protein
MEQEIGRGAMLSGGARRVRHYSLLDALRGRRSSRFAAGMRLAGGPLAYRSAMPPRPLSHAEEAALAFAACGLTGYTWADMPYQDGAAPETGGGNILVHFLGRTVASADAQHTVCVFVLNDEGTWLLKRPQDYPSAAIPGLLTAARDGRLEELYEGSRVRIAASRADVPREPPYVPAFNRWTVNLPGTTYFLPVNDLSGLYINVLLSIFGEDHGYFVVDDRNNFQPAGVRRFARTAGGHLHNDAAGNRITTIGFIEAWLCELAAIEQGAVLQNLGLMAQALGVGGFPHFAAHPFAWFQALGFRTVEVPLSRTNGAGPVLRTLLRRLGRDVGVTTAVGLEHEGQAVLKPFCPPYYRNMEEAVRAFVDYKFAPGTGTYRDGGAATGWRDGAAVQAAVPRHSDQAIAATAAYCDYVYNRYGRFPAIAGPFRTIMAYQAHHLDPGFYERFYKPETLAER